MIISPLNIRIFLSKEQNNDFKKIKYAQVMKVHQ